LRQLSLYATGDTDLAPLAGCHSLHSLSLGLRSRLQGAARSLHAVARLYGETATKRLAVHRRR
jgi:hypothetical protein